MSRLVHTGSVIADLVMRVSAVPEPGGDTVARDTRIVAGGGLNAMVAARQDGLDVLYAGLVGTGPFAAVATVALAEHGIVAAHPPVPGQDTGFCVALVDDDTERTFITHVGADGLLGLDHLAATPLLAGDLVYVSGYSLSTTVTAEALAAWLPTVPAAVPVLVDPSPLVTEVDPALYAPLLARVDVLSCNAREAAHLTGEAEPDRAAVALLGLLRTSAVAVVRDGPDGCYLARRGEGGARHVPAFPVRAVDSNGAGDAHAGVLMSGLARGLPVRAAALRANAAAAIAVTRDGPATCPTRAETDALVAAGV